MIIKKKCWGIGNFLFFLRVWMRRKHSPMTIQDALEVFFKGDPNIPGLSETKKSCEHAAAMEMMGGNFLVEIPWGGGVSGIQFFSQPSTYGIFTYIHVL